MNRCAHDAAGLTFLEVVISLAILAATVATMVSGYGAMERMALRDQDRLNAAEVAHQLILNYLYDPNSLPPDSQPLEQGKDYMARAEAAYGLLDFKQDTDQDGVSDGTRGKVPNMYGVPQFTGRAVRGGGA